MSPTESNLGVLLGTTLSVAPPSTESDEYAFTDRTQRAVIAVVTCLIPVIGIPGNLLVLVAVVFSRKLQTKTNVFVVNLAFSDFSSCLVLPFIPLALLSDVWPLPDFVCAIVGVIILIDLWGSAVNLALIAFNRYCLITRPRASYNRVFSRQNLTIMLFVAWVYPTMVILSPPIFGLVGIGFSSRFKICLPQPTHPYSWMYAVLLSALVQVPCLVITVACYIKIHRYVTIKNREILTESSQLEMSESEKTPNSMHVAVFNRQVQVTKNLFIVMCSYIVCIMPLTIALLIPPSDPLKPWLSVILVMNTCVNPIIYGLKHPHFREVFKFIVTCKWRQIPEPSKILQSLTTNSSSFG